MSTIAIAPPTTTGQTSRAAVRDAARGLPPPHLDASQSRALEAELRGELRALERRLVSERSDDFPDLSTVAGVDLAEATSRANDTLIRHGVVADALARLEAGTYGVCSRCGDPIGFDRLFAIPDTTHCLGCSGRA